ncbi:hypothetical protein [Novipirellula artificiosorum]|uniref:Uncharacterized protein n=1 Tax=Novipirellula artificiosorum TaxID=2528016 RepID=A0A5C6CZ57_9BACT|nr:hypothetical protein [Novipirellula artificiosorum]TWU27949.1 hypothetical protein Poly41_70230 [Novipirellula artificiosorum]
MSVMLPHSLQSSVFDELTLSESQFESGRETFHDCTYETQLAMGDRCAVNIVLNPNLDWPYPENAVHIISKLLADSETRLAKLSNLGTAGVFSLHRKGICDLGESTGYDRWNASEAQLFANWKLESVVNFADGFRLIYSGHPVYYLDLLLEFEASWKPTYVQFDG